MMRPSTHAARLLCAIAIGGLLTGCASGLLPKPPPPPTLLALDDNGAAAAAAKARKPLAATLVVETPRAAAGYDTRNIAYTRRAHEVEYYALHQWVDTPAHMLAPLMVRALQQGGAFRAVVQAPSAASGELRLETELLQLQQDYTQTPSRVSLQMRAVLVDSATRRVLATKEFNINAVAASEDPYAGAAAANVALRQLLAELAAFCAEAAAR